MDQGTNEQAFKNLTASPSWTPQSWRTRPAQQQPQYADPDHLASVLERIRSYPPLVFAGEVDILKRQLGEASRGRRFMLQGGDCAERFQDCTPEAITSKLKILLQMSVILCYGARRPVIRIGRMAGQYAKPRSADYEMVNGQSILSYRGDNINSYDADALARRPDPDRLLQSYHSSSLTLNYVRAMITGGFADLHHPEHWNLGAFGKSAHREAYQQIVSNIKDAIAFMESLGGLREEKLGSIEFYTSHEGLLLPFEESMTRYVAETDRWYNLSAHMLWIGDRTRQLDGAHVEYFRGIANPLGIKVGPTCTPAEVVAVARAINPANEPGRVVLITRFGHDKVQKHLPAVIQAVKEAGIDVVWSVDPMHGNVIKTKADIKTRDFDAILGEIRLSFAAHKNCGSILGGVHFELTGDNVTECTGGSEGISEADLVRHYETYCDPRLNYSQSLEMAFLISSILQRAV